MLTLKMLWLLWISGPQLVSSLPFCSKAHLHYSNQDTKMSSFVVRVTKSNWSSWTLTQLTEHVDAFSISTRDQQRKGNIFTAWDWMTSEGWCSKILWATASNQARSYWLTAALKRCAMRRVIWPAARSSIAPTQCTFWDARQQETEDWTETQRSLSASAAHHEGNCSPPGRTVRESDRGEGMNITLTFRKAKIHAVGL